jgi:hypothetical protein
MMATPALDMAQVEALRAEGLSERKIAERLGLSWGTYGRTVRQAEGRPLPTKRTAAPPLSQICVNMSQQDVTPEVVPAPGWEYHEPIYPPKVGLTGPIADELMASWQDLQGMLAWWRQRQEELRLTQEGPRPTRRETYHLEVELAEAVKRAAAREGIGISTLVNRLLRQHFQEK